ncbi:MAG: Preprotein translocase subunit SecY [Candidatus Alkanophagales archaeon MCA70_species_1]|nr:Preprotein translocase subunit SecY [Candidatus Alkanophaga volatiphilum]
MSEEAPRLRDVLTPILNRFPMVERPTYHVHFRTKLWWTVGILLLYFALCNIPLFGLSPESRELFGRFRAIFAGESFSLMALGIVPIVDASIVLQLLVGAQIIKLDLSDPDDQAFYQGLQKILVVFFTILMGLTYVVGYYYPDPEIAERLGVSLRFVSFLLFVQVCLGGLLIYFMDEVVSKWGIGSGVGLFILAGVSQQIVTGLINWVPDETGLAVGVIPRWIQISTQLSLYEILGGGITFLFEHGLIALFTTIAIFFIVVYIESTRIEIPLAHSLIRGARGRFPVKLLYASVLPMILVRALQASIQGFGRLLYAKGVTLFGTFEGGRAVSGLMYYLDPISSPYDWFPTLVRVAYPNVEGWQIALRVMTDISFMVVGGAIFALFWITTTGMGPKDIAEQIYSAGLQIPGYRRNPAAIERLMERYIPRIAILGGAILGALCVFANMLGTLGRTTGTGLLLAVSIAYGLYEQMASEQVMEMYPALRKFLGEE